MKTWITAPVEEVEPDPENYPGETTLKPRGLHGRDLRWNAWYHPDPRSGRCIVSLDGPDDEVDAALSTDGVQEVGSSNAQNHLDKHSPSPLDAERVLSRISYGGVRK